MKKQIQTLVLAFFAIVCVATNQLVAQEMTAEKVEEVTLVSASDLMEDMAVHTLVVVDNGEKKVIKWTGSDMPEEAKGLVQQYDLGDVYARDMGTMKKECSKEAMKECSKGTADKKCCAKDAQKKGAADKKCCAKKKSK